MGSCRSATPGTGVLCRHPVEGHGSLDVGAGREPVAAAGCRRGTHSGTTRRPWEQATPRARSPPCGRGRWVWSLSPVSLRLHRGLQTESSPSLSCPRGSTGEQPGPFVCGLRLLLLGRSRAERGHRHHDVQRAQSSRLLPPCRPAWPWGNAWRHPGHPPERWNELTSPGLRRAPGTSENQLRASPARAPDAPGKGL